MDVPRLDPDSLSSFSWDFTELELVPGIISPLEAIERAKVSPGAGNWGPDVQFEVIHGRLTSRNSGRWTGERLIHTCDNQQVWVVRVEGVSHVSRGSGTAKVVRGSVFYVINAHTGDLLLQAGRA